MVAGLDLGGTKAHLRAVDDASGEILLDEVLPNQGWARLDDTARAQELIRLASARLAPLGPASVVAGVHGSDTEQQQLLLAEALRTVIPVAEVVNDAGLVLPAAGVSRGTGVIAGTGSCAASVDAAGRPFTVGGWGWVLGDEGGAAGIVRDACRAVLAAWDEAEDDLLTGMLLKAIDADHPHSLGYLLASTEPVAWAANASIVFDAAARGSRRAAGVIADHVAALVRLLGVAGRRGGHLGVVVVAGGVFAAQDRYFEAFANRVREAYGTATTVSRLELPPVEGALHLARSLLEPAQGGR